MFACAMMESGKKQPIKKADAVLLAVILIIAAAMLLFRQFSRAQGAFAQVSHDGGMVAQIPLSGEDVTYYLLAGQDFFAFTEEEWQAVNLTAYENEGRNYNAFVRRDGEIRMIESSCPDLICVHHRAVSHTGENIICLPHKVVIEIVGARGQALDGVVY